MRLADVDPLARQAVMLQQASVARLKLALGREVVDRRAQAVAAMPSRYSSEFPQRILQAVGQRLERLRPAERHRLPIRVREDEVVRQMFKAFFEDGDPQGIHAGEIRGRQVTRMMHLAEHNRACRTSRRPPLLDATLEGATVALGKLSGMLLLEPVEQRLGPQAGLGDQPYLCLLPQFC